MKENPSEAYTSINADIWSEINDSLTAKATGLSHEEFLRAKSGVLEVSLAGYKTVPRTWFPDSLENLDILALASGGGQQGPVFAAHGARVTVTDLSDGQLLREKLVSEREGYSANIVRHDLAAAFPFADDCFDLIFHPISNCYIETIQPVWDECARVIRQSGILMMAFVKEEHFMFEPDFEHEDVLISRHRLPFNALRDLSAEQKAQQTREKIPFKFSHTLTEQIGGLIHAGFEITDLYEDGDGGGLFDKYMNSYVCVRAVKK